MNFKENESMREELGWMWKDRSDVNKLYMLKIMINIDIKTKNS